MERTTIRTLVQDTLQTDGLKDHFVRGSGVQASEVARTAFSWFNQKWDARRDDRVPRKDTTLTVGQESDAKGILAELQPRLVLVAQGTGQLVAEIRALCIATDVRLTLDDISGLATTAAANYVLRKAATPSDPEVCALAMEILEARAVLPTRLRVSEFVQAYADEYVTRWQTHGAGNLSAHPPAAILLGHNRQPSLALPPGTSETDACGTDRSVYSRYAGYRPKPPSKPTPFLSRAARCTQSVTRRSPTRDVASEEIIRACQPYGLTHDCHRIVLRATYFGLDLDEPVVVPEQREADGHDADRNEGRDLSRQCVTLNGPPEAEISAAVRRVVERRLKAAADKSGDVTPRTPGELSENSMAWARDGYDPRRLQGHIDRIAQIVVRRVWKAVHGIEMHVEEPICSCTLAKLVAVAFDRAVPAGLAGWAEQGPGCDGPDEPAPGTKAPEIPTPGGINDGVDSKAPSRLLDTMNATSELLSENLGSARTLFLLQDGWEDAYAQLIAHDPARYLSIKQFAEWCRDVVPGPNPEPGPEGDAR